MDATQPARALVADRDEAVRRLVCGILQRQGIDTRQAATGGEALQCLESDVIHFVLADVELAADGSLPLIDYLIGLSPQPVLVCLDASRKGDAAADWMRRGAFDLLAKPPEESAVQRLSHRLLRHRDLLVDLAREREAVRGREGHTGLVGCSPAVERARQLIGQLAPTRLPVWFHGPEGSGKEFAARMLHADSLIGSEPFVVVHCSELTAADWAERWAGPGAEGLLARSGVGTLYLDDVAALPPAVQETLAAGDGSASTTGLADYRICAGSRSDPRRAVAEGRVHDGLQRRLGLATVELPALRQRREDIPLLARHFATRIAEMNQLPPIRITREALEALSDYGWPGNVRELRHAIEHAVILARDGQVRAGDLPERIREAPPTRRGTGRGWQSRQFREAKREVVEQFERDYLSALLERHGGNVTVAAQHAGMLRSALQRLLRKYDLRSSDYRRARRAAPAADSRT